MLTKPEFENALNLFWCYVALSKKWLKEPVKK